MAPTKQTSGKNVTTLSPAQRSRTNVPEPKQAPADATHGAAVEILSAAAPSTDVELHGTNLTLIVASDKVRSNAETKVAHLIAENGVLSVKAEKSFEVLAAEYLRTRRMFPAVDAVRAILGEDTPDLAGRSPEYKAALARINETARDEMIAGLRKEGMTIKGATSQATAEMERIRKSVTRAIRIAIEDEAKQILSREGRGQAARFILGHGFGYSGEVGKAENAVVQSKEWKLKDGVLSLPAGVQIGEDGRSVVKVNPQAEPAEQSDQATPTETADKQEAERMGDEVLNPSALINEAVGMLNRAASLLPQAKLSLKERNAHRDSLLKAVRLVVGELEGPMDAAQVVDVNAEVASK